MCVCVSVPRSQLHQLMLVDFDEGCGMCVSRSQLHDLYSSTLTRGVVCMCVSSPQSVTPADAGRL